MVSRITNSDTALIEAFTHADSSDSAAQSFISRWRGVTASELSTAQSFVIDLCALLEVDKPRFAWSPKSSRPPGTPKT